MMRPCFYLNLTNDSNNINQNNCDKLMFMDNLSRSENSN